jgi:hypothetical protein
MNNKYAICIACGDSGQDSRGRACVPCGINLRGKAKRYAAVTRCAGGFKHLAGPTYAVNTLREYTPPPDTEAYIVLLGVKPKPVARWKNGVWQRKNKTKK